MGKASGGIRSRVEEALKHRYRYLVVISEEVVPSCGQRSKAIPGLSQIPVPGGVRGNWIICRVIRLHLIRREFLRAHKGIKACHEPMKASVDESDDSSYSLGPVLVSLA